MPPPDRLVPDRLVVVTATGTEVGKTWIASHLAIAARAEGWTVAARKPAQSFDPDDADPTDAEVLADATGAAAHEVCPPHRWYPRAYAPPMAADVLGRPAIALADLVAEIRWTAATSLAIVEGAGGVHSPLAHDGDTLDLIGLLEPDLVIVVADPELGTINDVRLTVAALGDRPHAVHLNRFDPRVELHRLNREWLERGIGGPVTVAIPDLLSRVMA